MKLTRNKIMVFIVCFILLGIVWVYFTDSSLRTVHSNGDVNVGYRTINELKNDSELIAYVTVDGADALKYAGVVFSISQATVTEVYKGDATQDTIRILETGGIYNLTNYIFEDNAVFKKKEKAIVFLEKYEGPISDDAYVILGAYQGKFKLDGDQPVPPKHARGELNEVRTIKDLKLEE